MALQVLQQAGLSATGGTATNGAAGTAIAQATASAGHSTVAQLDVQGLHEAGVVSGLPAGLLELLRPRALSSKWLAAWLGQLRVGWGFPRVLAARVQMEK